MFQVFILTIHTYCLLTPCRPILISATAGSQTTIFCATDDNISHLSGRYFTNCQLARESDLARHNGLGKRLWDVSMRATDLDKLNQ